MSDISTLIYKYLAENFGKQDWSLGSVIRELVAQPIVGLSEQAESAINSIYNKIDIAALLSSPEEHGAEIDQLFSELGLSTPTPTVSQGTVQILTSSSDDFSLPISTAFSYGDDITLLTTRTYNVTTTPTEDNDLLLKQIGINSYSVIVPVSSLSYGVNLGEGAQLTWGQINTLAYEAKVYSAITGGTGAYTATEKINLIQQRLFPQSLTCAASLLRILNNLIPESTVSCSFSPATTKSSTNLYVKTTDLPEIWTITAESTAVDANTQKAVIDGTGILTVIGVNGSSVTSTQVTESGRSLVITFAGTTSGATIEVMGLKTLTNLQNALDAFTVNTGVVFDLKVPTILELSMYLPTKGDTLTAASLSAVAAAVNNSEIDTTSLGDSTVRPILSNQGSNLSAAGTYILKDVKTGRTISSLSTINVNPFVDSNKPIAIYTSINKIGTTNG